MPKEKYNRLQKLGKERLTKISNSLIRGESPHALARTIQHEWGEFLDLKENTLAQQLNRFKLAIATQMLGDNAAELAQAQEKIEVRLLKGSNVTALETLVVLVEVQERRIQSLYNEERKSGKHNKDLDGVIESQQELALSLQKIRFDLGKDEFHGPMLGLVLRS